MKRIYRKVVKVESTGIGPRNGMGGMTLTLECGHTAFRFVAVATQTGKMVRRVDCDKCKNQRRAL